METKSSILKKYFGYDSFRDGQETLVQNILDGRDVLGVMPTGAGKSICYQVPAMLSKGVTIVISPLISLMKDQVYSLTEAGINSAFINSSLDDNEYRKILNGCRNNEFKLIYVAPERLLSFEFLNLTKYIEISIVAVDEAHCISQWGQDFRPSYQKIVEFIESLNSKRPVVAAFTATATKEVRDDILKILNLKNPKILVNGFDRKNLEFIVKKSKNKFEDVCEFLNGREKETGVIYCSTRKTTEMVCEKLNEIGINAVRYHAGLGEAEKKRNQEDFIYDRARIIVATNAFGMGIDKSNVSFVIHYNMPSSIESYYQEAGRAGRDGGKATCLLLFSQKDIITQEFLIEKGSDNENIDTETEMFLKERDRKRLRIMENYVHSYSCLRKYILNYFGDSHTGKCNNCSNCKKEFEEVDITLEAQKILSCVYRVNESFGQTIIADILKGSKNEKVRKFNLDKVSTYGIMKESKIDIKEIITFLVIDKYLETTSEKYPVLKLGKNATKVLKEKKQVKMLITKFEKVETKSNTKAGYVNKKLLEILKGVRMEFAREKKVPAFIIFSDSTLVDMAIKLPKNMKEMLGVSGVGQTKLERYGEKFLFEINEFLKSNQKNEEIENEETENVIGLEDLISDDEVVISIIADRINTVLIQKGEKKTSAIKLGKFLLNEGYLEETEDNGKTIKLATKKGEKIGIIIKEVSSKNGIKYKNNFYSKIAQEYIINNINKI